MGISIGCLVDLQSTFSLIRIWVEFNSLYLHHFIKRYIIYIISNKNILKQHKLHKCKYCNITKKRPWRLKIHENICLFNPINIKKNKKINKEKKCNCCWKIFILNSKNKDRVYCSLECKKKIYKKIFLYKEKIIKKV